MKIESITLQNYGAFHGSHSFQFDGRGLVLVLGQNLDEPRMASNGAGKSTLFDALDYCLFGDVPRGDHVDSVVNEDAGSNTKVMVRLIDDDGTAYSVARWRGVRDAKTVKPNGAALFRGPDDLTALDDAETQRLIERVLGLDREVFHALVLHAQTDVWNFAGATDGERVAMLTKVLQLGQIDQWLEQAKQAAVQIQDKQRSDQDAAAVWRGKIEELQGLDFATRVHQWDQQRAARLHDAEVEAQRAHVEAEAAAVAVPVRLAWEQRLTAQQAQEPRRPQDPPPPPRPQRPAAPAAPDNQQRNQQIAEARRTIATIEADIAAKRRDVAARLRDAETFEQRNQGVCGACRQSIDPQHVTVEVERLRADAQQIESSIAPLSTTLQQWRQHEADHEFQIQALAQLHGQALARYQAELLASDQAYQGLLDQHRAEVAVQQQLYRDASIAWSTEIAALQRRLLDIDEKARTAAQAVALARQAGERRDAVESEQNPWTAQQLQTQERLRHAQLQVQTFESVLATAAEQLRYVEFWIQAFGPRGLKNFILDARVQELTDAANHWMRLIFGGTSWVRFETQQQGRSTGKLSNRLNVRCFRYMPDGSVRERGFRMLSGGEKQRTSLAIDMGLSRIIASRATKRYDLLVLDEVFRHLDGAGREAVVELLQQLQAEKSSIFVVDHDREMGGAFEHRVTIRKQNGRSTIVEEAVGLTHDQDVARVVPQEVGTPVQKTVPRRRPVPRAPVA